MPAVVELPLDGMRRETFDGIRHQAELQLRGRLSGEHCWDLLPEQPERGFRLLPAPNPGDVWLDLEGHPFYEPGRGLEYLFGYCFCDEEGLVWYDALWGKDRDGERLAFERFVDWIGERRQRFPGLHVYHYAAYERTALTRLMGEHGTRELAIDALLRDEVLVDLYRVVKQSLRASVESYSIKELEKLYGFERHAEVAGGDESIVCFENWMETGDDTQLDAVERYNEEDCRSTVALHEWLLSLRPPELPWRDPPAVREPTESAVERDAEREDVRVRLLRNARIDAPERLLANLVDYHKREQRPQWWEWFRWPQLDDEELVRNRTAIGALTWDGSPPELEDRSHGYRLSFPPQEHKLDDFGRDPDTRQSYRLRIDDDHGLLTLLRASVREEEPLPRGLTPDKPLEDWVKRDALLRFLRAYSLGDFGRYPCLTALVERKPPAVQLGVDPVDSALSLRESYLFIQGPPGSGKTWQGARIAVALMRAGRRVGVTSLSHKAIHNLLAAIQDEADRQDFTFSGMKRAHDESGSDTTFESRCIVPGLDTDACADPSFDLVAGTGWALTRQSVDAQVAERPIDVLIVDEAGQLSLADVVAVGTSAKALVLLGDPNQLPQVTQGSHPEGSERSVLQHLLGDDVDGATRTGHLPRADVETPPRALRIHVRRVLRGAPPQCATSPLCGRSSSETARVGCPSTTSTAARPRRKRRTQSPAAIAELLGSAFTDVDGSHAAARRAGHPRRGALQRPGADAPVAAPGGRRGRHGGQVPGAAGAGRVRLDGELDAG